jgi:two-component system, LytTR family, sensor kinase
VERGPADPDRSAGRLPAPLLWVAPWLALSLLASINTLTYWRLSGWDYPAWRAFAAQAPGWLAFGILTPAVLLLGRRFPLRRTSLPRMLPIHLLAALLLAVTFALAMTAAARLFSPVPTDFTTRRILLNWFLSGIAPATLAYFGVLGVSYALDYASRVGEVELREARLAGQLAEARLGTLQAQLHPHFLFNSLNAVMVLLRDGDSRSATRMLELVSETLRRMLRHDPRHEVRLAEELEMLNGYLAIEQIRFSDRLVVASDVPDDLLDSAVPAFVLQPLVENALRHGIARSPTAGQLTIAAKKDGQQLVLVVHDDGPGLIARWRPGVGLSNTAARLSTLYDTRASVTVAADPAGGTVAHA